MHKNPQTTKQWYRREIEFYFSPSKSQQLCLNYSLHLNQNATIFWNLQQPGRTNIYVCIYMASWKMAGLRPNLKVKAATPHFSLKDFKSRFGGNYWFLVWLKLFFFFFPYLLFFIPLEKTLRTNWGNSWKSFSTPLIPPPCCSHGMSNHSPAGWGRAVLFSHWSN